MHTRRILLLLSLLAGLASCVGTHPTQAQEPAARDLRATYRQADAYSQASDAAFVRGSQHASSGPLKN